MGFFATLLGLLLSPMATLSRLEKRNPEFQTELASGFLTTTVFLGSVLIGAYLLLLGVLLQNDLLTVFSVITFAQQAAFGVVGALLGSIWYHLWLWLFGVRNWRKTMTAYFYSHAPAALLLLTVLPEGGRLLYLVLVVWTLVLFVHAVRIYHGLPLKTAGVVIAFGLGVNFVLGLVFPLAVVMLPHPPPSIPTLPLASLPAPALPSPAGPLVPAG